MRRLVFAWAIGLLLLLVLVLYDMYPSTARMPEGFASFAEEVGEANQELGVLAVQHKGRFKPVDTFARENLLEVFGETSLGRHAPTLIVLDWALSPDAWLDAAIIKIEPALRSELLSSGESPEKEHISPHQLEEILSHRKASMSMAMGSHQGPLARSWMRQRRRLSTFKSLAENMRVFPLAGQEEWQSLGGALSDEHSALHGSCKMLAESLSARNGAHFRKATVDLLQVVSSIRDSSYPPAWRLRLELLYQRTRPIGILTIIYLLAAIVCAMGHFVPSKRALRAGVIMLWAATIFHILALTLRAIFAERAMASNTFEYIIMTTVMTSIAGLVMMLRKKEVIYATIAASLVGIAHAATSLSPLWDRISPLAPVLQSKWLKYHVSSAAPAYGVLYLACGISIVFIILRGKGSPKLTANLSNANFKLIRLGFFLLTIGIITGATWADKAWGRYWGWDPKESWSLVAWCIYCAFLHLGFSASGKSRHILLAVIAIVGFIAVLFTFIGVNYILSGLHSYG